MTFWLNDFSVLFQNANIIPTRSMSFDDKLNASTRLIVLLSLLCFVLTGGNPMYLSAGFTFLVILCVIYLVMTKWSSSNQHQTKDGFTVNPDIVSTPSSSSSSSSSSAAATAATAATATSSLDSILRSEFQPTTKQNPFANVLLTDIQDTPNRKAAAPSFNPEVYDDINKAVKQQTQMLNPSIINTNKMLYGDLMDNYDLDAAMMRFYSMPNTRVSDG